MNATEFNELPLQHKELFYWVEIYPDSINSDIPNFKFTNQNEITFHVRWVEYGRFSNELNARICKPFYLVVEFDQSDNILKIYALDQIYAFIREHLGFSVNKLKAKGISKQEAVDSGSKYLDRFIFINLNNQEALCLVSKLLAEQGLMKELEESRQFIPAIECPEFNEELNHGFPETSVLLQAPCLPYEPVYDFVLKLINIDSAIGWQFSEEGYSLSIQPPAELLNNPMQLPTMFHFHFHRLLSNNFETIMIKLQNYCDEFSIQLAVITDEGSR